jgi:hypothetical protein
VIAEESDLPKPIVRKNHMRCQPSPIHYRLAGLVQMDYFDQVDICDYLPEAARYWLRSHPWMSDFPNSTSDLGRYHNSQNHRPILAPGPHCTLCDDHCDSQGLRYRAGDFPRSPVNWGWIESTDKELLMRCVA